MNSELILPLDFIYISTIKIESRRQKIYRKVQKRTKISNLFFSFFSQAELKRLRRMKRNYRNRSDGKHKSDLSEFLQKFRYKQQHSICIVFKSNALPSVKELTDLHGKCNQIDLAHWEIHQRRRAITIKHCDLQC